MRPKNTIPSYLRHKATGQARVILGGKTYYLGPYKSAESRAEYRRLCAEWDASNGSIQPAGAPSGAEFRGSTTKPALFVSELIVAYVRHACVYYVKDGVQTSEVDVINAAMRPVKELYGHTLARNFGPVALAACRQKLLERNVMVRRKGPDGKVQIVEGDRKLSRGTVNKFVAAIRLMFRWAAAQELIPGSIPQALANLPGLRKGRSTAEETAKIRPVRDEFVESSIPHMPGQVAAMVQIQALTGCRPGEIVIMRGCDLNTTGKIWEYTPRLHKTEHHENDRGRTVYLGPQAQEVLRPWLKADLEAYLFSPDEAVAKMNAERREARQTPVYPSHQARYEREKASRGRRSHRDHYSVTSYRQAIERACDAAKVPVYKPNQIRHSLATRLRREFNLETAGAVLGHSDLSTSQIYAEKDAALARQAMGKIG